MARHHRKLLIHVCTVYLPLEIVCLFWTRLLWIMFQTSFCIRYWNLHMMIVVVWDIHWIWKICGRLLFLTFLRYNVVHKNQPTLSLVIWGLCKLNMYADARHSQPTLILRLRHCCHKDVTMGNQHHFQIIHRPYTVHMPVMYVWNIGLQGSLMMGEKFFGLL
jgi:hypothetical protein